ncbi:MAG: hypothetical protein H9Q65_06240 [Spiroplasma ixodetis]|nr:hypothetical protein [Spiroplasma ixodetis]MBP1526842.1 hypothetical protein [Spiroplasma ixodetis]MBP1528821.1 hypothetical protein [Spiroplasma ixodetis]
MEKKLLTYPHDISKKLLIILGISKIAIGLSILFVFITNLIIYTNSGLIFSFRTCLGSFLTYFWLN